VLENAIAAISYSNRLMLQIKKLTVNSSNNQEKYNMKSKISQINLIILSFFILTFSACDSKSDELIKVFKEKPESELDIALNQKNDKKSYSKDDNISYTRRNAITTAVENVSPAVVGINVTEVRQVVYRDPFSSFFDDPMISRFFNRRSQSRTQKYEVKGLGSGFIIGGELIGLIEGVITPTTLPIMDKKQRILIILGF
jgi:S1-C subfamily serine protease